MVFKFLGLKKHSSSSSKRPYPTVIEELCHPFSLADLKKATNNFDQKNVIGQGGFAKVYKGCLQLDHVATSVAVKRMSGSSIWIGEAFKNEIELLCQLRHSNLVSLIGFCIHKNEKILVYEYMSNGSLTDLLLDSDEREALSWKKRLEICIGAARAVHYLHTGAKRTIIHRDIKPSNIFLDENMIPKLSDFGISLQGALFTVTKPKPIEGKPIAGTYGYMAPENIRDGILTDKCDVYSFGVVLLEMLSAKRIHSITNEMFDYLELSEEAEISNNITSIQPYVMSRLQAEDIDPALAGKIAPECYVAYIDIIGRCLKEERDERPTMGEVEVELEHALALQQEADTREFSDDYLSLFSTITQPQPQEAPIST